jgi:hypothetical protein
MTGYTTKDSLPIDTLTDHELTAFLNGQPAVAEHPTERRSCERRQFRCLRTAADWVEENGPPASFYHVQCRDLSARGIAFYSPKRPNAESLVVRLSADGEEPLLVGAHVVYCNDKSGDPSFPFVVGCMFTKRL